MDDEADLKKMIEVLKSTREDDTVDIQYQEFINSDDSDGEEIDDPDPDPDPADEKLNSDQSFNFDISTLYKYNPTSSLKSEERAVIDSCRDPDLKKLLLLNREKNMQLIQLYKKFKDLLIESKQNIFEKNDVVKQYHDAFKTQKQSSGSWRLCAPYFKDKGFFVCPQNSETVKKKNNNELSYYDLMLPKQWSKYECDRLIKAVKLNYSLNLVTNLKKNIKLAETGKTENADQIEQMKMQVDKLNRPENFVFPPLGSDENINWIRVADVFIRDKHSEFECRSFWHIFLHPSINKSPWEEDENKRMVELVKKYNYQKWDVIAKELGTNRSCFTAAKQYFGNFHVAHKKGEFTFNEDKKLSSLVKKYSMGNHIPWVKIARQFKNRTRSQLHHRYTYYLSQVDKKRGKFSAAEDVLILICNEKYGNDYKKCSEFLPERSLIQIKARFNANLKGILKKGSWTMEEDQIIMDYANENKNSRGVQWSELSGRMNRSRGQLRQRYNVVRAYLQHNPGSTVADAPRRKQYFNLDHDTVVRHVVDHFSERDSIPLLEEIEETLKFYSEYLETSSSKFPVKEDESSLSDVDELLTEYFWNFREKPTKSHTPMNFKRSVEYTKSILDLLNVNLNIPDDLNERPELDSTDIEILEELRKNGPAKRNEEIKTIAAPNYHTVTAMRGLLFTYMNFKRDKLSKRRFVPFKNEQLFGNFTVSHNATYENRLQMSRELSELPASRKRRLEEDRKLFYQRFVSLLKWPAILTLEPPTTELLGLSENFTKNYTRTPVKRTYSRKRKNDDHRPSKVRILEENAAESLKLTPVTDKSVIANLLSDNSKKLFCMDKVRCGDATKTLVKEIDLDFLARKRKEIKSETMSKFVGPKKLNNKVVHKKSVAETKVEHDIPSTSSSTDNSSISRGMDEDQMSLHTSVKFSDDNDFDDLEKLTSFIKMEKGGRM